MRPHDSHLTDEELLLALDGELPDRRQSLAEAHLAACAPCRERRDRIDGVTSAIAKVYTDEGLSTVELHHERRRLQGSLDAAATRIERSWTFAFESLLVTKPAWALLATMIVATSVLALELHTQRGPARTPLVASVEPGALPISSLTPGATLPVELGDLCIDGKRAPQRRLSASVRDDVLRGYAMEHVSAADYELDYLITPELGGAPDPANLWPQRYGATTWNARVKDQLETLLPRLVCNGSVRLEVAQREIATDWIAAYKKYFKTDTPLPVQAGLTADEEDPVFDDTGAPELVLVALR